MGDKPLLITTKPTTSSSLLVLVCNYKPIVVCYASAPGGEYVQSLATIFLHSVSSSELWRFEKVCYGVLGRIFHFTNYDRGFFRKETWTLVHVFSLCLQGWKLVHTATVNCQQAHLLTLVFLLCQSWLWGRYHNCLQPYAVYKGHGEQKAAIETTRNIVCVTVLDCTADFICQYCAMLGYTWPVLYLL